MSTHTSQKIDQKEYLKKYLSGGKNKKKKKDKKHKKSKDPPGGIKVTIIDDDLVDMDNGVKIDEELLLTGEDAPQIVGEYTEDIHNAVKNIPKWKSIVIKDEDDADEDKPLKEEDLWGRKASEIKIKQEIQVKREKLSPDTSPPRKKEKKKRSKRSPSNSPPPRRNKSPPRRKRSVSPNKSPQRKSGSKISPDRSPQRMASARNRHRSRSADNSPPRTSRFSEKVEQSPTRKGRRSPDHSPPRRRKERSQSPPRRRRNSDQSPARRKDRRSPEQQSPQRRTRESDQSPARKNKSSYNNEKVKRQTPPRLPARVSIDSDQSPPRKPRKSPDQSPTRRRRNYDQSPPRRGRRPPTDQSPPRRRRTSDQSPPRKGESRRESPATRTIKREKTSMDLSPQRRRRTSDQSPPRKDKSRRESPATRTIKREKTSMDLSPQRKNKHKSPSPPPPQRKSRWEQPASRYSNSPPPTHKPKVTKTLDGKRAGLQDAQALKTESVDRRRQEDLLFEKMSSDLSGRHAEVRVRNTGRKGRRAREAIEEDPEERRLKEERGQKRKEHYERLGKGLKQLEDHKNRQAEMEYEASKPLARHANDADLEQFLKDQERAEDPMLNYMREKRKEKEKDSNEPKKPVYEGPCPENRFGIRPGYRWDGVDRSNGYEKKWFDKQNERKARQIEAYQYSVEDM